MTNDRELFVKIDENFSNSVILGDGKSERVEGKGVIAVQSRSGEQKFIHDVLYVPTLAHNLLSVGQLIQKGYRVVFEENKCRVVDRKNQLMAKVEMTRNKGFPLSLNYASPVALKGEISNES